MKLKKKDIFEIIDTNGELIGKNSVPDVDANADSKASRTTDYNQSVGTQPYRYDMLGRFGFNMGFFESVGDNQDQNELLNDLAKLMYDKYIETLEYYYRNPNRLKPDFRLQNEKDFDSQPEDNKKIDFEWAEKVMKVVEEYFVKVFHEPKQIDEAKVVEDKMVGKQEDEMSVKSDSNEVREKRLEKIAGLINKLEKKDIDKLINLLERNG